MTQREQPEAGWREFLLEANTTGGLAPAPLSTVVAPTPLSAGFFPSPPPFDVIELLPSAAADKLRLLRQRSDDLHAIIPPGESIREASMARIEAENALKRLTDHPQDFGHNLPPSDARVTAATKHLEKMTADFTRLKELQQIRTATWQQASQAKAAVEEWLRHGRPTNTTFEEVEIEPPPLKKGEDILSAIEGHRRLCRELRADQHRIASAPYPSAYCKQRMREQVEQLAQRGAPAVSRLVELDGPVEFETQRVQSEVHGERRSLAFHEAVDAVGLVAWLHKDALIKRLDAEIDSEADDKAALSHEAREQREAEVQRDLLAVERDECALVWEAQAQNLPCEHRPDVSVLALLSITLVTAPRGETPETSAGYSWPWRR